MKKGFYYGLITGVLAGYFLNEYQEEIKEVIHETGKKIHVFLEKNENICPCSKVEDTNRNLVRMDKEEFDPFEKHSVNDENMTDFSFDDE